MFKCLSKRDCRIVYKTVKRILVRSYEFYLLICSQDVSSFYTNVLFGPHLQPTIPSKENFTFRYLGLGRDREKLGGYYATVGQLSEKQNGRRSGGLSQHREAKSGASEFGARSGGSAERVGQHDGIPVRFRRRVLATTLIEYAALRHAVLQLRA